MKDIIFSTQFDNQRVTVLICHPSGTAGAGYFVYFNKYYQGTLVKYQGAWVLHSIKQRLTPDHIAILGARVEKELAKDS